MVFGAQFQNGTISGPSGACIMDRRPTRRMDMGFKIGITLQSPYVRSMSSLLTRNIDRG